MYLGLIGSCEFDDYEFFKEKVLEILGKENIPINDDLVIVSGGGKGTESLAQNFAKEYGLTIIIHYPNQEKHGKKADIIRNVKIVRDSEIIIAFPKENSVRTKHTVELAKKVLKKVYVINV